MKPKDVAEIENRAIEIIDNFLKRDFISIKINKLINMMPNIKTNNSKD